MSATGGRDAEPELIRLCRTRQWNSAITQVNHNPWEAFMTHDPHGTAIATACRYSGPALLIQALLDGMSGFRQQHQQHQEKHKKQKQQSAILCAKDAGQGCRLDISAAHAALSQTNPLRLSSGGRGTPLHEAVENEEIDLDVIKILIEADRSNLGLDLQQEGPSVAEPANDNDEAGVVVSAGNNSHHHHVYHQGIVVVDDIDPPEAICTQDVDGQIPLHLMIRRVFRSCPRSLQDMNMRVQAQAEARQYDTHLLQVLADVIDAYPEGCSVSDKREYQETPFVHALKANLYAQYRLSPYSIQADASELTTARLTFVAPTEGSTSTTTTLWDAMLETRICHVLQIMLQRHPPAANHVSAVASNRYTMLHSALFHGRTCKTLKVVMDVARRIGNSEEAQWQESAAEEARNRRDDPSSTPPSLTERRIMALPHLLLQPNTTNAEMPLHVACMRLEKLAILELLCREGPRAVSRRDRHGRTPLMWLWIRYGATSYNDPVVATATRPGGGRNGNDNGNTHGDPVVLLHRPGGERNGNNHGTAAPVPNRSTSTACSCAAAERPVTFFDMRYVPVDHVRLEDQRTARLIELLQPRLRRLTPLTTGIPSTGLESWLEAFARNPLYNFEFLGAAAPSSSLSAFQEEDELNSPGKRRVYHNPMFSSSEAAGAVLLWEKVLVMLRACQHHDNVADADADVFAADNSGGTTNTTLLHVAATFPSVPSFVVDVALKLYPHFVSTKDEFGRLPLHCAAARQLYEWKPLPASPRITRPTTGGTRLFARRPVTDVAIALHAPGDPRLFADAAIHALDHRHPLDRLLNLNTNADAALSFQPLGDEETVEADASFTNILQANPEAVRVFDNDGRLPLHHAITSAIKMIHGMDILTGNRPSNSFAESIATGATMHLYHTMLQPLLQQWPASLEYSDTGATQLLPFMQAAALPEGAASISIHRSSNQRCAMTQETLTQDKLAHVQLNIVYSLLRLNPEMVRGGVDVATSLSSASAMRKVASTNSMNALYPIPRMPPNTPRQLALIMT
jgi:hypothetical protein